MSSNKNINFNEVILYTIKMRQWAAELKRTRSGIMSKTRSLEFHWKDSEYHQYLANISSISKSLDAHIEQLERSAIAAEKHAKELKESTDRFKKRQR